MPPIDRSVKEPHIFAIGARALAGAVDEGQAQAILIAGESGAGKTETTKLLLQFVTSASTPCAAGSKAAGLTERAMQANPVLEAFGNAMTVRNNNSSRFGEGRHTVVLDPISKYHRTSE